MEAVWEAAATELGVVCVCREPFSAEFGQSEVGDPPREGAVWTICPEGAGSLLMNVGCPGALLLR